MITQIKHITFAVLIFLSANSFAQKISCDNKSIEAAFNLAIKIVDSNTRNGILAAGADYGGEWTRDISINSWNGVSLLRPAVAEQSLWSVTINKDTIGHQYWDKIIWVMAAYNHYKITSDKNFLSGAYKCAANSIANLEQKAFDADYQLFTGPSVFNDGIAGYPEPIFEPGNNSSFVLDHKGSAKIKCLSTNCIYYGAYRCLADMAKALNKSAGTVNAYSQKAGNLKRSILKHLYDSKNYRLNYLIDQNGKVDHSQEALGISFAVLFGILDGKQAHDLIAHAAVSKFGITSVYPDFARYSNEKPGRHNNIVWPMANGFFANAALKSDNDKIFTNEFFNLTHLALDADKGANDFKEIYNPYSGTPDGGWQGNGSDAEHHWKSCNAQTWSATAYISMLLNGLLGIKFDDRSLSINPFLPKDVRQLSIKGITYRDAVLDIDVKGTGKIISSFKLDGKEQKTFQISDSIKGNHQIVISLK